ncbi:MAG: hypothetical protein WBA13_17520 [Microcoleaceae cyanobacterium]
MTTLTNLTPAPASLIRDIDTPVIEDWTVSQLATAERLAIEKISQLKAAQLFQQSILSETLNISQPGIETIFLADLYRRAGNFVTAAQILNQALKYELEASLLKVLEYEQHLIQAQDTGYYQMAEALEI